jgi:Zn-dependent metalloprotease
MASPSRAARWLLPLVVFSVSSVHAQVGAPPDRPGVLRMTSAPLAQVQQWDAEVGGLVQRQDLVLTSLANDPLLPDRYHEHFKQVFRGIPVYGGGVSRQVQSGATVSLIGVVYTDIDLDTTAALTPETVAALLRQHAGADLAFGQVPSLIVVPRLLGGYALAYRVTLADQATYFVDARTGSILQVSRDRRDQGAVGVGTGAHGEVKKISTTLTNGSYRTEDTLRPANIHTFDTRGSNAVLDRLLGQAVAFDSDYAVDADNSWADARIVDTHVHSGWSHDYFAKRFNWRGLDGLGAQVVSIAHRLLTNNAFFISPPFGPGRLGAVVFGDTNAGRSMAVLDIVGHEIMHGVTHHALLRRTGQGLGDTLWIDRIGPSSFSVRGSTFPCSTSVLQYPNGQRRPFVCDDGRYVLVSNHPGDIDEATSDIFGTSLEFFMAQAGRAPDYLMGEDLERAELIRRLDNPAAVSVTTAQGPVAFPDHVSRRFTFPVVVVEGTSTNPDVVDLAPIAFVGDVAYETGGHDSGGVHWNSTVLGHAFYLAIEGGRNQTSGVTVTGVGPQSREDIERVFFRAVTHVMPSVPNLSMAAASIRQAAIDLFGGSGAATRAVSDALTAVGLP